MMPGDDAGPRDVHPNDRALLYDLVDGRLAPRAADEVKRRLDDEPELRHALDEIVDLRTRLAALPAPALPADFVERVRAKAGFPAAPPAAASPREETREAPVVAAASTVRVSGAAVPPSADAANAHGATSKPGEGPPLDSTKVKEPSLGRVVSFARYAYGVAALFVVALGAAFLFWESNARETNSGVHAETASRAPGASGSTIDAVDTARAAKGARSDGESKNGGSKDVGSKNGGYVAGGSAPPSSSPGGAPPRFRGPVGALPSGLREPSDDPNENRPPPAPRPLGDSTAPSDGAPAAGTGQGAPADAPDAGMSGALARLRRARTEGDVRSGSLAGGEDVLYVYADSLDEARAEVAIWVDDARAGRLPDARRLVHDRASAAPGNDLSADKKSTGGGGKGGGVESGAGPSSARGSTPSTPVVPRGAIDSAEDPTLGTFVVELESPAFDRLSRSLPASALTDAAERDSEGETPRAPAETAKPEAAMEDAGPSAPSPTLPPAPAPAPTSPPELEPSQPAPPPVEPRLARINPSAPAGPAKTPESPSDEGGAGGGPGGAGLTTPSSAPKSAGLPASPPTPDEAPTVPRAIRTVRIVVLPNR